MEAGAVMVFVTGCDHSYVASNDVAIVLFQPLPFAFDRSASRLRRIAPFKSHLQWDLHDNLSVIANSLTTMHQRRSSWLKEASLVGDRGFFHEPVRTTVSAKLEQKSGVLKTMPAWSKRLQPFSFMLRIRKRTCRVLLALCVTPLIYATRWRSHE